MRQPRSLPRACCLLLALGLALTGGQAFARGGNSKKKGSAASSSSTQSASAGRKHPTEVHLKDENPDPGGGGGNASATTTSAVPQRGPARIDFDDRLIQGQTNKSGAVYLYDRKELKTRSMIKMRDSFREETVGSVYDG